RKDAGDMLVSFETDGEGALGRDIAIIDALLEILGPTLDTRGPLALYLSADQRRAIYLGLRHVWTALGAEVDVLNKPASAAPLSAPREP
ncbi:MAG: hypothetical protein ACHQWU_16930, partial [Gemmatimonadales bacterium]